jgi:hypothetical protein
LKIDAGIRAINGLRGKRLPIDLTSQKSDIGPGSRTITTSDQNDLFHLLDSQSKPSDEGKPTADVLKHPLAKVILRKGVFASSLDWKG